MDEIYKRSTVSQLDTTEYISARAEVRLRGTLPRIHPHNYVWQTAHYCLLRYLAWLERLFIAVAVSFYCLIFHFSRLLIYYL